MTAPLFQIGQRLTDYSGFDLLVHDLKEGGFGVVALGIDQTDGLWQAVKILKPDLLGRGDSGAQQRLRGLFLREALTWRGLWPHPSLLTAQFVVLIDGQLMLVLDYAEDGSLRDRFENLRQQNRWLTVASALHYAQQIAAGLLALHTPEPDLLRPDPIVHRDLKPENILLSQGQAMITDFGLAKAVALALAPSAPAAAPLVAGETTGEEPALTVLVEGGPVAGGKTQAYHTQVGVALGTPAYMAPEQWRDASSVERPADAYAFGVILTELLTSRHPLLDLQRRHSLAAWRTAHLSGRPTPLRQLGADMLAAEGAALSSPAAQAGLERLERLLARLLAKLPSARPGMRETQAELQAVAEALGKEPYRVPDIYPRTPDRERIFWMGWANAYSRFELYEEALPRIERARQLAPENPKVLSSYGTILAGLGREEEAVVAYRESLARRPAEDVQGRSIVLNQLGNLLSNSGHYAEAEVAYAEQLALTPNDAPGWYNRAFNEWKWAQEEAQAGRRAEARVHVDRGLAHIEHAIKLNPANPNYPQFARTVRQLRDRL